MQNNYIVCPINKGVLLFDNIKTNVKTIPIYRELKSSLAKVIRSLHLKLGLPFFSIWFTPEFKQEIKFGKSSLIFFDSILTYKVVKLIRNKCINRRIIYWYWNHIYTISQLVPPSDNVELWSYDPVDCKQYNLRKNTQFYFPELNKNTNLSLKYDFFFIGKEKGRESDISRLYNLICQQGFIPKFIVIGNSVSERIKKWTPYNTVINYISQSRCIVDIVHPEQKGLTLRPLEALFLKKKLITNFNDIKHYDFYKPENIFIIGENDDNELLKFINTPYIPVDDSISIKYTFQYWLNNFNHYDDSK